MNILLLNAGSSSLKCTLMDARGQAVARGLVDWAGATTRYSFQGRDGIELADSVSWKGHAAAVSRFVEDLRQEQPIALTAPQNLAAVGHRIVHGGEFSTAVLITPEIRSRITGLCELAPLHNPPSIEALGSAERELPHVPQVAVFDTAFHATLPAEARTYAVPDRWTREWGIRRFGFHGLSHSYCSRRAMQMLNRRDRDVRLVVCHLGHGCSMAVVRGGRCIDTTMGFTPMDGLMMATRSGSVDPGILLHVQERHGLRAKQIENILNRESGLLGVSGISGDMRQVMSAAKNGHERAQLAISIYTRRVRQAIGAAAVTLGGIDALVFTAGVGENSAEIRASICTGLQCLGVYLDIDANQACQPDADIATGTSTGRILVIAAREDITMFEDVQRVLGH